MKMIYFKGKYPNFGDELNPWMWPRFFPNMFDEDERELFLGIGSIIGTGGLPPSSRKIIFGAAFVPEYKQKPNITANYDFRFVRGKRTAQLLGLSEALVIGDSATLLHALSLEKPAEQNLISFMPHWESIEKGNWAKVCGLTNLNFIDPRSDVEEILKNLLRSKLVLTEAMHGAIVADALRIPWIPLQPIHAHNRAKWLEWADTLKLTLPSHNMGVSSLQELKFAKIAGPITRTKLLNPLEKWTLHSAAEHIERISREPPLLSKDADLSSIVGQMIEKVEELRREKSL